MTIIVYGESHFHSDEVTRIRDSIVEINPNILLLENVEDKSYYETRVKSKILELEEEYIGKNGESLSKQFMIREKRMISNIQNILKKAKKSDVICIQVGDTHLRTIYTKELGINRLRMYLDSLNDVTIVRSEYKEIE